ncbi:hypothetical protein [Lewinella sp. IMCC34183]|uniref:hypothetical protein n=1 Tax=Lewinella sp. IMCC34183 TaxID=2248762 RepID=UPI000E242018|nr:hypothetical protein [Lewinella sp. IMCC34183]
MSTTQAEVKTWLISEAGADKVYFYISGKEIGILKAQTGYGTTAPANPDGLPHGTKKKTIPFSYIRYVESHEDKREVVVHYKKESKLTYDFSSVIQTDEVMQHLLDHDKVVKSTTGQDSWLRVIRKPLLALLGLGGLLGWGYLTAVQLENGEYFRQHFVVVLLVAGIGTEWLSIILPAVVGILCLRIGYLIRNNAEIHRVYFRLK